MIEKYLRKLQQLQLRTLGTPVSMQVQTRWDRGDSEPWLVITVYHEDWVAHDGRDDDLYLAAQLYQRGYCTQKENNEQQLAAFNSIKEFVEKLLSI